MRVRLVFEVALAMTRAHLAAADAGQQVIGPLSHHPKKYAVATPPLDTDWTYQVGTEPWPQYPRPKLVRSEWLNLNGIWTYDKAPGLQALRHPPFNQTLSSEVLVPFCLESGLSGIQDERPIYSWYRKSFTVPKGWNTSGNRILLNFGAIDYEATVFVNRQNATFHRGGYDAFSTDITNYLKDGDNELLIFVFDPTESGDHVVPVGKQTHVTDHIRYRSCSGIWQTVWLEPAPTNYITDLKISGDADGLVNITITGSRSNLSTVEISVRERGSNKTLASHTATAGTPIIFNVQSPLTWSPSSPHLYELLITMGNDIVSTYTGFRTISRQEIDGVHRIVLNGEPIFIFGTLDQGYWPDGLYTPPTYEAMIYDIKVLKSLGFNMLRKHVKIESPLYYAAADELGILIVQDMPSLAATTLPNRTQYEEFKRQVEIWVDQLKSYGSIISWVIYNEGWGQPDFFHADDELTSHVRAIDPTRLINSVSGWFDHGFGDFSDNHHYTFPRCGTPTSYLGTTDAPFDPSRIGFQGEFGGIGHNLSAEHLWKVQKAIDGISHTYEMYDSLDQWNFRGHFILSELLYQVQMHACAGAVWTETTDVEGELNGMLSYDRRILRPDVAKWRADIEALYEASAYRTRGDQPQDVL